MKKTILTTLTLAFGSVVFAQSYMSDNRFQVGYSSVTTASLVAASISPTFESSGGFLNLSTYKDSAKKRTHINLTIGANKATSLNVLNEQWNELYNVTIQYYYLLARYNYDWYKHKSTGYYSGAGIGIGYKSLKSNKPLYNEYEFKDNIDFPFQLTVIGWHSDFWHDTSKNVGIGAFSELGIGYMGIFNFGLQFSF